MVQDWKGIIWLSVGAIALRVEVKFERREVVSSVSERPAGRRMEPSPPMTLLYAD